MSEGCSESSWINKVWGGGDDQFQSTLTDIAIDTETSMDAFVDNAQMSIDGNCEDGWAAEDTMVVYEPSSPMTKVEGNDDTHQNDNNGNEAQVQVKKEEEVNEALKHEIEEELFSGEQREVMTNLHWMMKDKEFREAVAETFYRKEDYDDFVQKF